MLVLFLDNYDNHNDENNGDLQYAQPKKQVPACLTLFDIAQDSISSNLFIQNWSLTKKFLLKVWGPFFAI